MRNLSSAEREKGRLVA